MNYVYLLHFKTKYKHCQHYLGATVNLESRLKCHIGGYGARLVRHVVKQGNVVTLGRLWMFADKGAAFHFEEAMKARKNNTRYCEICNGVHTFEEMQTSMDALITRSKKPKSIKSYGKSTP